MTEETFTEESPQPKNLTRKNPRDFFYPNELKTNFPPKTLSQEKILPKEFRRKSVYQKRLFEEI